MSARLVLALLLALPCVRADEPQVAGHTADAWLSRLEALDQAPALERYERRGEAVTALWELGSASTARLLKALDDDDVFVREAACLVLARLRGSKAVVDGLFEQADDDANPELQRFAIAALGRIQLEPKRVVPALCELLVAADPRLQECAAGALGRYAWSSRPAREALLKALPSLGRGARALAWQGLERAGPVVAPALVGLLTHADEDLRGDAAQSLLTLLADHPHGLRPVLELVRARTSTDARSGLPDCLDAIGSRHPELRRWVGEQLEQLLGDDDAVALEALRVQAHALQPPSPLARKALARLQRSDDAAVAERAAELEREWTSAVAELGAGTLDAKGLEALLAAAAKGSRDDRVAALDALGRGAWEQSPRNRQRVALALREAMGDDEAALRGAAARAAGALTLRKCLPDLLRLAREDDNGFARERALRALRGVFDPAALPVVEAALGAERARLRSEALRVAAAWGPRAAPLTPALLAVDDPEQQRELVDALTAIGPAAEEGVGFLAGIATQPDLLGDSDAAEASASLRCAAIAGLGRVGGDGARVALRKVLRSELDALREAAREALKGLALDAELEAEIAAACERVRTGKPR